jgi:hypothetical protein
MDITSSPTDIIYNDNINLDELWSNIAGNSDYNNWKESKDNNILTNDNHGPQLLSIFHTATRLNSSWIKCLTDFVSIANINLKILTNLTDRHVVIDTTNLSEYDISLIIDNYSGQEYQIDHLDNCLIIRW